MGLADTGGDECSCHLYGKKEGPKGCHYIIVNSEEGIFIVEGRIYIMYKKLNTEYEAIRKLLFRKATQPRVSNKNLRVS